MWQMSSIGCASLINEIRVIRVPDPGLKCGNLCEISFLELEVEDLGVLGHSLGIHGLRDDHVSLFDVPSDDHLGRALAVFRPDLQKEGTVSQLAISKRVPGQGGPCHRRNGM